MSSQFAKRTLEVTRSIEGMLLGIRSETETLSDEPKARGIRSRAETYARVLRDWSKFPPSEAQREALFDLVSALLASMRRARAPRKP